MMLKTEHFHTPPPPTFDDVEQQAAAMTEYNRKHVKPEPKWRRFDDEMPELTPEEDGLMWSKELMIEGYDDPYRLSDDRILYLSGVDYGCVDWIEDITNLEWAYADEYNEAMEYYQSHRVMFEGWEYGGDGNNFYKGDLAIEFGGSCICFRSVAQPGLPNYTGKCTVDLFREMLKVNGYES